MVDKITFMFLVLGWLTDDSKACHLLPELEHGPDCEVNDIIELSNKLSSDIYQQLSNDRGNIFYSPLSISIALAMIYYGARGNSAAEMREVLGYNSSGLNDTQIHSGFNQLISALTNFTSDKYVLDLADAIFVQRNFAVLPQFVQGLKDQYFAEVRNVDFSQDAINEINSWVRKQTRNNIQSLLESVDPLTVMMILNAIYFKGQWETQFNTSDTQNSSFLNNGMESNSIKVQMMRLFHQKFMFYESEDFQVLELPYNGGDICMRILLPKELNGLTNLEEKLSPSFLVETWGNLKNKTVDIIAIPKFNVEYQKSLSEVLISLGIKEIFTDNADLSGIGKALTVSDVFHKSVVEVNEEGSKAAGVTGGVIEVTSAGFAFIVNRPFLFYIMRKTDNLILFNGRISVL